LKVKIETLFLSLAISTAMLTGCSASESSTRMIADVILLDISSGLNEKGTYSAEDRSITSLSSRAFQLREKLSFALADGHAVYFGFVRQTYGQQQIETLISPKLIQTIESILFTDVKDANLRKDAKEGILAAWDMVISSNTSLAKQPDCQNKVMGQISYGSNGSISDRHQSQLASALCSNALNANEQIEGLINAPENIGSEIQAAIDRSIEKISSDERRLFNSEGKPIYLQPTIILVSDLIQVTNGQNILDTLFNVQSIPDACQLAQKESENYEIRIDGMTLVSDGFASTKGNIEVNSRDKLREYWKCWFESRGITDQDLGTRGINLGEI
jgi:hypothetical protein